MNDMMDDSASCNSDVSEAFKKTCRVLLHDEIGELSCFEGFLRRYSTRLEEAVSSINGKKIHYSEPYCKEAKFVSYGEAPTARGEPFDVNEVKDIDSLFQAASERFWYSGDKVLGNSKDVKETDNCFDSVGVLQSKHIWKTKYAAYCEMLNESEYVFGCTHGGEGNGFCMNTSWISTAIRCFETGMIVRSSDIYYSYNCNGCRDLMFCFNLHSKMHAIGNCPLPKEKYFELKEKLLAEIADILRREKTAPALARICSGGE